MYYELTNEQKAALYSAKVARRRQRKEDRMNRMLDRLFTCAVVFLAWVVSVALILAWW